MKQFIIVIMLLSLYSCVGPAITYVDIERQKENPYYVAPAVNSPLLFEKKDIVLNPGLSFSNQRFGADFMFAIKPFENVGFMVNYNAHAYGLDNGEYGSNGRDISYLNSRIEVATGYSKKLNESLLLETFAGAGYALLENDHATGSSTINQTILFLQPAVGFRNASRKTELGFVLRFQGVNFDVENFSFNQNTENHTAQQFEAIQAHPWQLMLEPGAFARFGNHRVKLHLGINFSQNLTINNMDAKNFTASIGTTIKLNRTDKHTKGQARKPIGK